ncbi:MAG: hypothetical protein IPJ82_21345 [Lewinellaceae bacterium]|nr:hypothetical protein [Lewinellaceae bacterium]
MIFHPDTSKQQLMIPNRYFISILLAGLFATAQTARAQCTSDAGTLAFNQTASCHDQPFFVAHSGNQVLDADDIFLFVAYTGNNPDAGSVFATSADGNFAFQPVFMTNSPFRVAAVAGNNAGGSVDWNDPCLSVSPSATVIYMEDPVLTVTPGGVITCGNTLITINASANQQNLTYLWSNNVTTPNIVVSQPGIYTVTVTNAGGCSATGDALVLQDIAAPVADAGSDIVLTCAGNSAVLNASSSTPGVVFTWVGPNGFTSTLMNPIVINPGVYTLIVTAPNGCTTTDQVIVSLDATLPFADAGGDAGIPCGGGNVPLQANAPIGGLFTYAWATTNGNIFSGANTINPIVTLPGTYTLVVTNTTNGCTAADEVIVFPGPVISNQDFGMTQVTCFGYNDGAINLVNLPAGGQAPFNFQWTGPGGYTSTQQNIAGLVAGTYSLIATDATSCSFYANLVVSSPSPATASFSVINVSCFGASDGAIQINMSGGVPPYTYTWNPLIPGGSNLTNLQAGVYSVTITDANGCFLTIPSIVINQPPQMAVSISEITNTCNGVTVVSSVTGGNPPYMYIWSHGLNGPTAVFNISGIYTVTVIDAQGCSTVATYDAQLANGGTCGFIEGYLRSDTLQNCLSDPGEPGLGYWLVRADSPTDTLYGITGADGKYVIGVPLGVYTVTAVLPNYLWELCPPGNPVNVNVSGDTFPADDILVKKIQDCPAMTVSIGTSLLRRCFSNNYYFIEYCNEGTAVAEDAFILIALDPFLAPLSATLPYTNLGNNLLRFNLGDVDAGECGNFSLQVQVSCNAALGQTHCTEAHIYPDSLCLPPNAQWSGASLQVTSQCNADSVYFFIQNVGAGNMLSPVDYIVVEDAVMLMQGLAQLDAGAQITLAFPANGSTWHVEVAQEPFHPGNSQPALSVEGCTSTPSFSMGFLGQFPPNDADPWIDIDCTANTGSYDPNDKQGFPLGYGSSHYIRPGTPLEYLIRFQNTGTDTAFTVRVVDTLSAWLDPATIQPGASSHTYKFDLNGHGIASFLFENILLPDSNVNQAGSNGFLKFTILPRADAPLETVIENDAAIYFDFNDPVITNTVFHRLGENFLVGIWQPHQPGAEVKVTPNPFSDEAMLEVKGLKKNTPLRLQVFDLQGGVVSEMESPGAVFHLRKGDWPAGIYLFSISQEGRLVGSGKLEYIDSTR